MNQKNKPRNLQPRKQDQDFSSNDSRKAKDFLGSIRLTPRIILGYLMSSIIAVTIVGFLYFYKSVLNMVDYIADRNMLVVENISFLLEDAIKNNKLSVEKKEHFEYVKNFTRSKFIQLNQFVFFRYEPNGHRFYQSVYEKTSKTWVETEVIGSSPYILAINQLFTDVKKMYVHKEVSISKNAYIGSFYVVKDAMQQPILVILSKENFLEHGKDIFISFLKISVFILVGLLISFTIGFIQARSIVKPLKTVLEKLNIIASSEADFTQRLEIRNANEIGDLGRAFNLFAQNQQKLIQQVQQIAVTLSKMTHDLHRSFSDLMDGAENQAEMIQKTTVSNRTMAEAIATVNIKAQEQISTLKENMPIFESLIQFIFMVEKNATKVNNVSVSASLSANQGKEIIADMVYSMEELNKSSDKIGRIISIVRDVADQTRLLALNAAIEAARAKEHGKGFAVVADEVSGLAEKSAEQVKGVTSIINENHQFIEKVMVLAHRSEQSFWEISGFVDEAKEVSNMNVQGAIKQQNPAKESLIRLNKVAEMSTELTTSIHEQNDAVMQLADTMDQISTFTQSTHKLVEDLNNQVDEMNKLFANLDTIFSRMKI